MLVDQPELPNPITTVSSSQYHHHCIITTVSSPVYHHHCIITTVSSPLYRHHCIITTVLSPLYHHHCIITTVSSQLYHHHCIITTVSSPLYHHHLPPPNKIDSFILYNVQPFILSNEAFSSVSLVFTFIPSPWLQHFFIKTSHAQNL